MKIYFVLITCLIFNPNTYAQSPCINKKQEDSISLIKFSKEFKKAVMSKEMRMISSYFKFPLDYKECLLNNQGTIEIIHYKLSEKEFKSRKYNDFFSLWFMETVSKGYVYDLLDSYKLNDKCKLTFTCPATFLSKQSSFANQYFAIEKIQGRYKITSSWQSE